MGKKFRWTEAMLCKYDMMRQAGYGPKAIAAELGITAQQVYDKKSGERKKVMSKYPKVSNKAPAEEVWRMFDEGKTRKEIADHFGVALQTICNRITAGRPKEMKNSECKVQNINETVKTSEIAVEISVETAEQNPWQTVPAKDDGPAAIDDAIDNNDKGDTTMEKATETPTKCIGEGINNPREECCTKSVNPILTLAARASRLADVVGFSPDHMIVDTNEVRESIRISGCGADGKVFELELTVTDPQRVKLPPIPDTLPV